MNKIIYTMPEAFMADSSVPVKWRLYGLINGFWVNGLTVYASNQHFAAKLNCTTRQIQRACEELEKGGMITRDINGYKRLILPGGTTPDVVGDDMGSRPGTTPDVVPMHSSNSSNKTAARNFDVTEDEENPKKERTVGKDKRALSLREKLYKRFEDETGVRPTTTFADYSRVLDAQKMLKDSQILDMIDDALAKGKVKTVREALTARAIDVYRLEYA